MRPDTVVAMTGMRPDTVVHEVATGMKPDSVVHEVATGMKPNTCTSTLLGLHCMTHQVALTEETKLG